MFTMKANVTYRGGIFNRAPESILQPTLRTAIDRSTLRLQQTIVETIRTPRGTANAPAWADGTLAASIQTAPALVEGNRISGSVFSNAKHAVIIEKGARPHTPPLKNIARWMKVVGVEPTAGNQKPKPKGKSKRKRLTAAKRRRYEVLRFAFAIQQKIAKRGLPALRMFENSLKREQPYIDAQFAAAELSIASQLDGA